jgi:subtilisin family serine protease
MTKLIKEKIFHDVKKDLYLEKKASDVILKHSSKNKRVTVTLNNNEPFYIYYKKFKTREIMRDNPNTNWFKYVVKKIKKEIYKRSYKESYLITLFEGCNQDDLDVTDSNIHIKKAWTNSNQHVLHAYLTRNDIITLERQNVGKIDSYHTDSYVEIPEQDGYPAFKPKLATLNSTKQFGIFLGDSCSTQPFRDVGIFESSRAGGPRFFPLIDEVNGVYNPNVVYIFIFDTGIAPHLSLNINRARSRNYVPGNNGNINRNDWTDRNGHGTHVAGIAAGIPRGLPNTVGDVTGIASGNQVISYKVLPDNGSGAQESWLQEAVNDIHLFINQNVGANVVVNMSLGSDGGFRGTLRELVGRGVTVVAAAGNGQNFGGTYRGVNMRTFFPAAEQGVIAVGALGRGSFNIPGQPIIALLWERSNFGEDVDILAPGQGIPSTWLNPVQSFQPNNFFYRCQNGTSMATPMVTGAVALIMANNRRNGTPQNPRQIRDRLRTLATRLRDRGFPENTPALRLNVSQL